MAADQPAPGTNPAKLQNNPPKKGGGGKKRDNQRTPEQYESMIKKSRQEAAKYRLRLKANEAEKAAQSVKDAENRGEYKALYEAEKARIAGLEAQVADLQSQVKTLSPYRDAAEQSALEARQAALATLPEDMRASFENADVATIQAVAGRIAASGTSPAPQAKPVIDPKKTGDPQPDPASAVVPGTSGLSRVISMLQNNKG